MLTGIYELIHDSWWLWLQLGGCQTQKTGMLHLNCVGKAEKQRKKNMGISPADVGTCAGQWGGWAASWAMQVRLFARESTETYRNNVNFSRTIIARFFWCRILIRILLVLFSEFPTLGMHRSPSQSCLIGTYLMGSMWVAWYWEKTYDFHCWLMHVDAVVPKFHADVSYIFVSRQCVFLVI